MGSENNICIIPARGGSKRFRGKNVAIFDGKPLVVRAIEDGIASDHFSKVVVSTDDNEIAALSESAGAEVHKRSRQNAGDTATLVETCLEIVEEYSSENERYDNFCLLQVVCPLRNTEDIIKSYEILKNNNASAVISVTEWDEPPWWALVLNGKGMLKPLFTDYYEVDRTKLPAAVMHNGAVIWQRVEDFLKQKSFMAAEDVYPYMMPRDRSIEVDYKEDLENAELLLNKMMSEN